MLILIDGDQVRKARESAGYTQAGVSVWLDRLPPHTNASQSRISQIEMGHVPAIEEAEATRLAAVLGVPLSAIVAGVTPAATIDGARNLIRQALDRLDKMGTGDIMPAGPAPRWT